MKLLPFTALGFAALTLSACGGGAGGSSAADPAQAVAACASCHTFNNGGGRRAGPNLFGVVGRTAGTEPGFTYSPAMKNSGIVWNRETLDRFLAGPNEVVPGTRMNIPAVGDPARRQAMIDYLAGLK